MNTQHKVKGSQRDRLIQEVYDSIPSDQRANTAQELEFLIAYRRADEAGKRRIRMLLHAASQGLLPKPEETNTWTQAQLHAFADALPEVTP